MTEQRQPPQRIGDAERDRAVELLREHMAQGRLTTEEFDERLSAALTARTSLDLDPLFTDLPGPRPGQEVSTTSAVPTPPWSPATPVPGPAGASAPVPSAAGPRNPLLAGLTAGAWPITLLLLFALPHGWDNFWWLIFIPIVISSVFGKNTHDRREHERRRIERQQRELDRRRRALGD